MTVVSDRVGHLASLYQDGFHEAHRHKWIQSEKLGRDLGDAALHDWYGRYWSGYCRIKRIEHVIGDRCWQEFQDGPSQFLLDLYHSQDLLFGLILDRVSQGWENLDVIVWSIDWGLPMDRVQAILLELNINCARLEARFS